MAEVNFDEVEGYSGPSMRVAQVQRAINLVGGLTSLALVVGVAVWGYKLAVRDVTGIPVIRAAEGPMRIAPEDPGGEITDHTGLSVNTVAAVGEAAPVPDRLVLAPPPVELTAEDQPGVAGVAPTAVVPVSAPADTGLVSSDPALAEDPVATDLTLSPEALADALVDGAAPLTDLEPDTAAPVAEIVPGGVGRSLRPVPRPEMDAMVLAAVASASAQLAASPDEIDPATLAAGTRLVQLGAFDDAETARAEWARLETRFGDLMAGKARVIQMAESGGRSFYRLRAHGFADEADARRFCSALLAENAACVPTAHR